MSSVRVIVVEGAAEDVVRVCAQLGLGGGAAKQQSGKAANGEGIEAARRQGSKGETPPSVPRSLDASVPAPASAPAPVLLLSPRASLPPPSKPRPPAAMPYASDAARDVVVPPHPTMLRRTRVQLLRDLGAVLPEVGDTVVVNDFVFDRAETQQLKLAIDRHDGDRRFQWVHGMAGGTRPARIRRVEE